MLAVLNREQLQPGHVPAGLLDQGRGAGGSGGAGDGGGHQAGQPRRLLHPGRGHPGVPGGLGWATRRASIVAQDGTPVGRHDGAYGLTIGQRKGLRVGVLGRGRPAPRRAGHRAGDPDRDRRGRASPWTRRSILAERPGVERERAAPRPRECLVQGRGPTAEVHRAAGWAGGGHVSGSPWDRAGPGARPRARPRCCTTATRCWAAAPSAGPGPERPPGPNTAR